MSSNVQSKGVIMETFIRWGEKTEQENKREERLKLLHLGQALP